MSVAGSKPIRILILLNRIPYPLNDGGAIGAFNFVKGYSEAGCEVTMLAMNTSKHYVAEEKVNEVFTKYGRVHVVYIDNRIKPVGALLNLFTAESYVIERFVSDEYRNKLIEILKQNQFDVVHVDGLPPSVYIDAIRAHSQAKISMRAHNVEHIIWQRGAVSAKNVLKKWYLSIQYKRLRAYEMNALAKCDVVMAISKEDENTIKQCASLAKTIIIPAGMDISESYEDSDSANNNLFFIGSFDWLPNLQGIEWFFENVWSSVLQKFPSLQFVIAGKRMPESIAGLKSKRVVIAGEVSDAKEFILTNGIMVVPLVSGSGIRIKIVEAMALGKTIIATTIAAEGLGLTDGENVLIANTADEFVGQIGRCLNESGFGSNIGRNAHRFAVENFQNKRIFEKLTAYYRQITR